MLRFVLIIILFGFANPLLSEDKANIYTVDMNKLLRLTDFGKNMVSVSNRERQFLQDENDALEEELLQEEKDLSLLRKTLSADEFRPKAIEFDKKVTIIRTQQNEKEKNLIARSRKAESDFFKRIYPLLSQLLSDRGGEVLIDQRSVILWNSSIDLTDDAIELINTVLGTDAEVGDKLVK